MDTYTASEAARMLDTSTPRVVRAAKRLGFASQKNGRMSLSANAVERLRQELGQTPPIPGLSATEVKTLAALARAPLGLSSARVLANQAGVSPTAASKALRSLQEKDLARREDAVIAAGRTRSVRLAHANRRSARWLEIAPSLARVLPPKRRSGRVRMVPPRLRHLFWNTAPAQLNVDVGGPYVARRLLNTLDFDGLAWGAGELSPSDWEQAARGRGLDKSARALAHNLALYGLFGETKVEFLHADEQKPQHVLEAPGTIAGLHIAGLKDLMAMKLAAIGGRRELRDYYDVKTIEEQTGLTVEDGIALFVERYDVRPGSQALSHLLEALGYLDDLQTDDSLPIGRDDLLDWWRRRQARLVRNLSRNPL